MAVNPSYPQCTVTFSGNWSDQDVVWLHIGGSANRQNGDRRRLGGLRQPPHHQFHSFGSVWQYHVCTALAASNTGSGQAAVTGDLQGGTLGVTWVAGTAAHER